MKKYFTTVQKNIIKNTLILIAVLNVDIAHAKQLFHLDFEKGLDAAYASGNGKASVKGNVEYINIKGFKGHGLMLRDLDNICRYKIKDNLNPRKGTVSFWIQPVNWDSKDTKFQLFFMVRASNYTFLIYRFLGMMNDVVFIMKHGKKQVANKVGHVKFEKGKWMRFTVTWDESHMKIYINGELQSEKIIKPGEIELPQKVDGTLSIVDNKYWKNKHCSPELKTVIDEVKIYDNALSPGEIKHSYKRETGAVIPVKIQKAIFSIPEIENKIEIDGKIDNNEWHDASCVSGFMKIKCMQLTERNSTAYMCYDNEALYVAFKVEHNGQLVTDTEKRDGPVYNDDAVEVLLFTGKNKSETFQVIVNSKGIIYDSHNSDKTWNGNITTRSYVRKNAWECEMKIPYRTLGIKHFKKGDELDIVLTSDLKRPQEWSTLAYCPGGYFSKATRFRGVFVAKDVVVRLQSLGLPVFGSLDYEAKVLNPNREKLIYTLKVNDSANRTVVQKKKVITDKEFLFKFSRGLEEPGNYFVKELCRTASGRTVFARNFGFIVKEALNAGLFYHSRDKINLEINFPKQVKDEKNKIEYSILNSKGKKILSGKKEVKNNIISILLPKSKLPAGFYTLELKYQIGNAKAVQAKVALNEVIDTRFLDHKIDYASKVIPPFTALKKQGNCICPWGRKYCFKNSLLPAGIMSKGKNLLAGKVKMVLEAGGNQTDISENPVSFNKISDVLMSFEMQNKKTGAFTIIGKGKVEYDGMMLFTITIKPDSPNVMLDKLYLDIPLNPKLVKYILTPKMKKWNEKKYKSKFDNYICISDGNKCMVWFAESDVNFNNKDRECIKITNDGENACFRLSIIDHPVTISGNAAYTFGLMAGPIKPELPLQRKSHIISSYHKKFKLHPGSRRHITHGWKGQGCYVRRARYKEINPRQYANVISNYTQQGINILPYSSTNITANKNAEFDFFKKDWINLNAPSFFNIGKISGTKENYDFIGVCASSTWPKLMLYEYETLGKKYKLGGIYYDMCYPYKHKSDLHNCGYKNDIFGKSGEIMPILKLREVLKKSLYLVRNNYDGKGILVVHMHDCCILPCWGFADSYCPGEELCYQLKQLKHYTKVLSMDRMIASYSGRSYGIRSTFLPQFGRLNNLRKSNEIDTLTEELLTMIQLVDGDLFCSWNSSKPPEEMWLIRDKYPLNADIFVPYWDNKKIICNDKEIKISYYRGKEFCYIVIGNLSQSDKIVKVKVPPEFLGNGTFYDERAQKIIKNSNGEFSIKVKQLNYGIVTVK